MRLNDCDILPRSEAKSAGLGERSGGRIRIILSSSGLVRAAKSGSLHAGSAEDSEPDFVRTAKEMAVEKVPPSGSTSLTIGGCKNRKTTAGRPTKSFPQILWVMMPGFDRSTTASVLPTAPFK